MPTYQQQQQYPTPGVDTSARLSDSAAQIYQQGADQQAKGLEKLGQGLEQASKAGYDLYTDYQTSQAREAFNQYRAEEMQQQAKLSGLSGKDAIDPEKGVQASITAWQQEARERLGKNLGGMARGMFDNATQIHGAKLTAWGMEKTQTEQRTYMNQQDEGTIAIDTQSMLSTPFDATAVRNSLANIEDRYKALRTRNGWSDEYAKAKMDGHTEQIFSKMVQNQINSDNVSGARDLMTRYGTYLGGSRATLEGHLNAKGRELEARGREEKERNERKFSADFGNQLFSTFRLDAAGAQQQIEEKVKDPVLQERVFQSYLTRSAIEEHMQSKIAKQAQAADYNNAINKAQAILQDGEITDKATALSSVVTNIGDQETRKNVRSFVDDVLNGTESPYSKTVLAEAQEYAAQPGVTADMVTSKYKGQLPYSALQKATKTAESEQSKRSEQLMRDEITQILTDKYGFAQHQATAGYRTILSKITGITDPEQRLKMAREFTREISIKDSSSLNWRTGWFGGAKVPAYEFTHEQETSSGLKVRGVPDDALPVVDAGLKAENIPITKESRLEYYTKMLTKRVR